MNLLKLPKKFQGKVKAGALLTPHVDQLIIELNTSLNDLTRLLKKEGYRSLALSSRGAAIVATRRFQESSELRKSSYFLRPYCRSGGLWARVGTHSLLITPEFGTRARLAAVLTEAPLKTTQRIDPIDDCTHCLDCVSICPVGAIAMPAANRRYQIAADKCKFYRERIDNCGLCQKVCSYATGHSEATGGPLASDPDFQHSVTSFSSEIE